MTQLDDDRPTLLLFGDGESMLDALVAALRPRAHVSVAGESDALVPAVLANVPDLTVLVGHATETERAGSLLRELRQHPLTEGSPVALLAADDSLSAKLRASEYGMVSILPRGASADGMARQMVELAEQLYADPTVTEAGDLAEASVDDLVQILGRELQSGILSVSQVDGQRAERFVVRAGQPMRAAISQFIERVRPLIAEAKPLQYAFHEAPLTPLFALDDLESASEGSARAALAGRRFLLIANNPAHADALAQELRACDAVVVVVSADGSGWDRARDLDPEVALIDEEGLNHWGFDAVAKLRSDPQLRWAALVVMDSNELLPSDGPPRIERLAANIARLNDSEGALRARAAARQEFVARLETVGPTRILRALLSSAGAWNVRAKPRGGATVTLALAEGLVAGASAQLGDGPALEGAAALACLLVAGSGRLRATPAAHPSLANMLMPLDEAVRAAHAEGSPLPVTRSPSTPPPATERRERPPGGRARLPAASTETAALVGELEDLVGELNSARASSLPPPAERPAPRKTPTAAPASAASAPVGAGPVAKPHPVGSAPGAGRVGVAPTPAAIPPTAPPPPRAGRGAAPLGAARGAASAGAQVPSPARPAPAKPAAASAGAQVPSPARPAPAKPAAAKPAPAKPMLAPSVAAKPAPANAARPLHAPPPPAPRRPAAGSKSLPPPPAPAAKSLPPPPAPAAKSLPPPAAAAPSLPAPPPVPAAKSLPPPPVAAAQALAPTPSMAGRTDHEADAPTQRPPGPPVAALNPPTTGVTRHPPAALAAAPAPRVVEDGATHRPPGPPVGAQPAPSSGLTHRPPAAPVPVAMAPAPLPTAPEAHALHTPASPTAADDARASWVRTVSPMHVVVGLCVVIAGLAGFALVFAFATRDATPTTAQDATASAPEVPTAGAPAAPAPAAEGASGPPAAHAANASAGTPTPPATPVAAVTGSVVAAAPTAARLPSIDPGPMPDEHAGAAATVERYRAALSRGSRARSRGDLQDALDAYQFALHLKPRSSDAALGMARTYLEAEQGADALRWAERGRDLEQEGIDGRLLMGDALLMMGQLERAVSTWEEAQTVAPRDRAPSDRIRRAQEALDD